MLLGLRFRVCSVAQGDAKSELCDFLEAESVDLLIVGFSAANRFKKAFAGGSVSSHMLHHAACPVVVLPLKSMAWEEQDAVPEMRHSTSNGPCLAPCSSAPPDPD